jgi:hypothetical protein
MSSRHNPTRARAAGLTAAALAAPSALADNLRSTDTRDPTTAQAQQRTDVVTGGVRAPGQRTRQARDAMTPVTPAATVRTPAAPTVVEIKPAQGFDWTSAAIGAGGGIALALIAIAATATVSSRSRPAPH